ncbi:MAG TPA: ABC transporter permease [Acidimicrobiales bacterium]|jgi:putative ABC transport system permease protein|nr:ABC transporter permease [Acidimicrobiales bacterium]
MLGICVKSVWSHKRRLVGAVLAVVFGVAFLSGTLLLGDTLSANFDSLFTQANGSTDVVVRSATKVSDAQGQSNRATVDASLIDQVQRVDGVAAVVPYIEGYGQLLGRNGDRIGGAGPPTRAANWVDVASLNPYHLVEGRAPAADDEVVINRGAAKTGNLQLGETTTLFTPQAMQVRIVGITAFGSADGFGPSTFTGLTLDAAQQHLTVNPDRLTELRVEAEPGVPPEELASRISSVLPSNVQAITGTQLAAENFAQIDSGFLGVVRNGLVAFAVIALLVAAFSIFNTFSILVTQRSREAALLRALGATRRQIITTSAVETLTVGVVGSAAGWVAGVGLAGLLKAVFDSFGFALPAGGLVFKPASTVLALVAGVVATVVAGVVPSVRGSRIPPVAALRDLEVEPPVVTRRRTLIGVAIVGLGAAAVIGAVAGAGGGLVALGAVACLIGAVVLGPVAARPATVVLGRPIALARGLTGDLARQNAMRHPRRTAATASALMVGVSVVALFTVFGDSLKASAAKGIDDTLTADVIVDTPGYGGQTGASGFGPELARAIAAVPGVHSATGVRGGNALIDGSTHAITVADPATLDDVLDLDVTHGDISALDASTIAVSDDTADANDWQPGSTVTITYPDGSTAPLTIAAAYDHRSIVGNYLLAPAAWTPHAVQAIDRQVLVKLDGGADATAVRSQLADLAKAFGNPRVQTLPEYRTSATEGVDTVLGLIYVMLALAILIALMSIANTLSLSIHERRRELGLLRAVGQTSRQARSMVRWESVIIATFGTLGGILLGTFLGWGLVEASSSGTITVFSVSPKQLVVFLVIGALAGTLAGIRPARRAARLDILAAIASE